MFCFRFSWFLYENNKLCLEITEYSGDTSESHFAPTPAKLANLQSMEIQRDVNYKRFWEYFRIFWPIPIDFWTPSGHLELKNWPRNTKLLIFNIFQTDRLDFNVSLWGFLWTEIDWNGRKYKNKCKEWDYVFCRFC